MRRSLSLVGGVCLAVILSQFPEYAQQYTQRLGGAVDELHTIVADFDATAAHSGLTRNQALERYKASSDSFLSGRGTSMSRVFARYASLRATLTELKGAGPVARLRSMPAYFDSDIGGRTLDNFEPAVPVTPEGLGYAGAGLALGYLLISVLYKIITMPFRRRRVRVRRV